MSIERVNVNTDTLWWAMNRSRKQPADLPIRLNIFITWLEGNLQPTLLEGRGNLQPTFKQLEDFAQATATPLGYFFLPEPPEELLPLPDFRTIDKKPIGNPSANLLDSIYAMQRRSDWMREIMQENDQDPLPFVGSSRLSDNPVSVAHEMRRLLNLEHGWASQVSNWQMAVGELRSRIEELGIIAVINGVVGNNTRRKLDVNEFRGFAICDLYAPVIFVNGADYKSAQMFTLAHELAHVWIGKTGISGFENILPEKNDIEQFCDAVAAEFLVPTEELKSLWPSLKREADSFYLLARKFKVSPIVAARRTLDLKLINKDTFFAFYNAHTSKEDFQKTKSSGGDFYNNQNTRVGRRFAIEVIRAAKEGRIQFKEAYRLTDLHGDSFEKYIQHIGINPL